MSDDIHGQQLAQAVAFALQLAKAYEDSDVRDLRGDYLLALEDFQMLLIEFRDAIGDPIVDTSDATQ